MTVKQDNKKSSTSWLTDPYELNSSSIETFFNLPNGSIKSIHQTNWPYDDLNYIYFNTRFNKNWYLKMIVIPYLKQQRSDITTGFDLPLDGKPLVIYRGRYLNNLIQECTESKSFKRKNCLPVGIFKESQKCKSAFTKCLNTPRTNSVIDQIKDLIQSSSTYVNNNRQSCKDEFEKCMKPLQKF